MTSQTLSICLYISIPSHHRKLFATRNALQFTHVTNPHVYHSFWKSTSFDPHRSQIATHLEIFLSKRLQPRKTYITSAGTDFSVKTSLGSSGHPWRSWLWSWHTCSSFFRMDPDMYHFSRMVVKMWFNVKNRWISMDSLCPKVPRFEFQTWKYLWKYFRFAYGMTRCLLNSPNMQDNKKSHTVSTLPPFSH